MIRSPARLLNAAALAVVLSAFFVTLGGSAALIGVFPADAALREMLLGWASPPVLALMRVVNYGGDWRLLLPGMLVLFTFFPRARTRWWVWTALMVVAPIAEGTLKLLIGRARPEGEAFGFPSGHATAAAAFFGALLYLAGSLPPLPRRLVRVLAVGAILLVAMARVILRAHWPSDVLGGVTLGLALASLAAVVAAAGEPAEVRVPASGRPRPPPDDQ